MALESDVQGRGPAGPASGAPGEGLLPPAARALALRGWWPRRPVSAFPRPPPRVSASSLLTRTPATGFGAPLPQHALTATNYTRKDPVSKQNPFPRLRILGDTIRPGTVVPGRHLTLHGLGLSTFKTEQRDWLFGGIVKRELRAAPAGGGERPTPRIRTTKAALLSQRQVVKEPPVELAVTRRGRTRRHTGGVYTITRHIRPPDDEPATQEGSGIQGSVCGAGRGRGRGVACGGR